LTAVDHALSITDGGVSIESAGTLEIDVEARGPILDSGSAGANIQGGKIVFDYTDSNDDPAAAVFATLADSYDNDFVTGQLRDTTAVTTGLALGWLDDQVSKVTVMGTPYGDANLDGVVDATDAAIATMNIDLSGVWADGDFDYSGVVSSSDITVAGTNLDWDVFLGLGDSALAAEVRSAYSDDNVTDREDMLAIFGYVHDTLVSNSSNLSATDFTDLQTIVASAGVLNMPNYVAVLAGDVVNGSLANTYYHEEVNEHWVETSLGDLGIGSTPDHLEKLVSKWFLGGDHPDTHPPESTALGNDPNTEFSLRKARFVSLPYSGDLRFAIRLGLACQGGRGTRCELTSVMRTAWISA
jgi:hypothetical protein